MYPDARPQPELLQEEESAYAEQRERLGDFRSTLPHMRRALANVATYAICDDRDVTDDWSRSRPRLVLVSQAIGSNYDGQRALVLTHQSTHVDLRLS